MQGVNRQNSNTQRALDLRKRGATGIRTPDLLHAMPADSVWLRRPASDTGRSGRRGRLAPSESDCGRLPALSPLLVTGPGNVSQPPVRSGMAGIPPASAARRTSERDAGGQPTASLPEPVSPTRHITHSPSPRRARHPASAIARGRSREQVPPPTRQRRRPQPPVVAATATGASATMP
jgi:hypothetical protein